MDFQPQRLGLGASSFSMSPFSGAQSAPARKSLGQAEQTWYSRAKSAVAEYDNLWARAQEIAYKEYREQIASQYHGNPNDPDGAFYRRNSVAENVSEAEGSTPINYLVFGKSRVQNRVEKLEEWNRGLKAAVESGEKTYGKLEKQVIEKVTTVEKSALPGWVVPVMMVTGLVVLGSLVFGKD